MRRKRRTDVQLEADGFAALVEKLGIVDAIRYIQLLRPGEGDYTKDRHQILEQLGPDEIRHLMAKFSKQRLNRSKR